MRETSDPQGPAAIPARQHPVYALTTSELDSYRRALERALGQMAQGIPVPERLRTELDDAIAEQEQRARIRQVSRDLDNPDHYSVRQLSTAELERTKRDLKTNLGLIYPDSPAHVPIRSHMRAIDAELAKRADGHQAGRLSP